MGNPIEGKLTTSAPTRKNSDVPVVGRSGKS
jgi:hypothetical protein